MTTTPAPIYELAGQQQDPLAEQMLALVFTDQPVRTVVRPRDARRHWSWRARGEENTRRSSSRLWLSFAQPFTDTTVADVQARAQAALDTLVPYPAASATATAQQISTTSIALRLQAVRADNATPIELTVGLAQGAG